MRVNILISAKILIIFFAAFAANSVSAATFTVTNTNDSGAGSLRQAVLDANAAVGSDVINFDATVFNVPRTITVSSLITITGNGGLTINGTGMNLLTISGNNAVRVFEVSNVMPAALGEVTFNNLTIADGLSTPSSDGAGGGIGINNGNQSPGANNVTVTINNVIFRNNRAGVNPGGAIGCWRVAIVNVNNSTFTGNSGNEGAIAIGGGIGTCDLNVTDSSFYENNGGGAASVIVCCGNTGLSNHGNVSINRSAFYNNGVNGGGSAINFGGGGASVR